jgi:hypothetical protein
MSDVGEREENVSDLWDRQPGEPKRWFLRFQRYYLYRGLARSVRRAYAAFLQENYPSKADDLLASGQAYHVWLQAAKEFSWRQRAEAWDEYRNDELRREVLQASRFLMENALKAVEALVNALVSPRLTVVAANSILDRVGLPSVSRQELLSAQLPVSADDLGQMKDVVRAWEQSTLEKSG